MKLTWYGTAALVFASGDTAIAFDPFFGIAPGDRSGRPAAMPPELRRVQDVFVTHGHFDHILQIPVLCPDVRIHATATPCRTLRDRGVRTLHELAPGQTVEIGPFTARAYQSRHCRFDAGIVCKTALSPRVWRRPRHMLRLLRWNRRYPENGETLFYELCAEGKRVQILGSLGLDPATDYPTGADVLILPFQGRSDPAASAEPIVRKLAPKRVLLDHCDDSFPPMTAEIDTRAFEALLTNAGTPCSALQKNETILL